MRVQKLFVFYVDTVMSKTTILDEIFVAFNMLGKSCIPMWQIYFQIKKSREQNNVDVGNFNCLKSYIRWSIFDNSDGRGKDFFKIYSDNDEDLVKIKIVQNQFF